MKARAQALVILESVVAPWLDMAAADVEADAKAAPVGPQHNDAGGVVGIGALEHIADGEAHVHRQRVELLGTIEGDDTNLVVGRVENQFSAHMMSSLQRVFDLL